MPATHAESEGKIPQGVWKGVCNNIQKFCKGPRQDRFEARSTLGIRLDCSKWDWSENKTFSYGDAQVRKVYFQLEFTILDKKVGNLFGEGEDARVCVTKFVGGFDCSKRTLSGAILDKYMKFSGGGADPLFDVHCVFFKFEDDNVKAAISGHGEDVMDGGERKWFELRLDDLEGMLAQAEKIAPIEKVAREKKIRQMGFRRQLAQQRDIEEEGGWVTGYGESLGNPGPEDTPGTHKVTPRPAMALREVEYSDSVEVAKQREKFQPLQVGTRVKVKALDLLGNGRESEFWFPDGQVIDRIGESCVRDGWKLTPYSVKVWFDNGRRVKWFSPSKAGQELCVYEPGEHHPPLSQFGAFGAFRCGWSESSLVDMYIETHGGHIQGWKNVDSARKDNKPDWHMHVAEARVFWDAFRTCFTIQHRDYKQIVFDGTRNTCLHVHPHPSLSTGALMMMSMALRAQAAQFDDGIGLFYFASIVDYLQHAMEFSKQMIADGILTAPWK